MPVFLQLYVLGGSLVTVTALLGTVRSALAGWSVEARRRLVGRAGLVLFGWFVLATALAAAGAYAASQAGLPTIQYGLVVPVLAGLLAAWLSPTLRGLVAAVPQSRLIGLQLFRVLGVVFLVLYAVAKLPGAFALPAGIGDVAIGLAAPFVARAAARNPAGSTALVRWWNGLGLVDLAIAVGTGFLTSPSPLQQLAFDRPNLLITAFPLVLIPTFLVPIAVLLHIASLGRLARDAGGKMRTLWAAE